MAQDKSVGYKYKGEDVVFLVEIPDASGEGKLVRPFDQTGGSHSMESDELEVSTKDRTGVDYADVTESRSFEGELVLGDPFIKEIKKLMRSKKFVKIYQVDLITDEAEYGYYMIANFEQEFEHGEFATYSLEANLFGETKETQLTEVPEGAPSFVGDDDDNSQVEG